mgnify:CR=1 FL=1
MFDLLQKKGFIELIYQFKSEPKLKTIAYSSANLNPKTAKSAFDLLLKNKMLKRSIKLKDNREYVAYSLNCKGEIIANLLETIFSVLSKQSNIKEVNNSIQSLKRLLHYR